MDKLMEIVPTVYEGVKGFVEVDSRRGELDDVVNQLAIRMEDIKTAVSNEERIHKKKRKNAVDAYLSQTQSYIDSARTVLDSCQGEQWMVRRMMWVPAIERHYREGQGYLTRGRELIKEGLTWDVLRTRLDHKLPPLEEDRQYVVCATIQRNVESAVAAMMDGGSSVPCIGIYGQAGSGKTSFMKYLHNKVFDDKENFKALFWATAPEPPSDPHDHSNYHKALQKCVADGMWLDLDNGVIHDEVRSAGMITARLQEIITFIGPGRVVLFLDDVRREFPAYEVLGLPSLVTPTSTSYATATASAAAATDASNAVKCILVFTARSKDICNRMRCDLPLKIDLLEANEAQELFLHEVGWGEVMESGRVLSNREKNEIQEIAVQVANQCARMPLAIIIIARSMAMKDDLREWRNRLNELTGRIATIHYNDEAKILEQLKFGYYSLRDSTVQHCFVDAANILRVNDRVPKVEIIQSWKTGRLIGTDRPDELADYQGHTILNQLERMCLLQVLPDHQSVTMNKWVCKMAATVS